MIQVIIMCKNMSAAKAVDPGLVSSQALAKAGRTSAARFRELPADQPCTVFGSPPVIVALIANEQRAPLNLATAAAGTRMIAETDPTQTLHRVGVLNAAHALQLATLRAVFQELPEPVSGDGVVYIALR